MFPGTTSKLSEGGVTAAASINVSTDLVNITGATTINTIIPHFGGGFSGIIWIRAIGGTITLGTGGNILVGTTIAINRVTPLIYSKSAAAWYIGT